jgi:hypothetical protein
MYGAWRSILLNVERPEDRLFGETVAKVRREVDARPA